MRRLFRQRPISEYPPNNSSYEELRFVLSAEQCHFCAYTEVQLDLEAAPGEIDHFDPSIKGTAADGPSNWFVCTGHWNRRKQGLARWQKYQPILHPSDTEFEDRLWFESGFPKHKGNDNESKNLVKFLFLDDPKLVEKRQGFIERIRSIQQGKSKHIQGPLLDVLKENPELRCFPRILRDEFGMDIDDFQKS